MRHTLTLTLLAVLSIVKTNVCFAQKDDISDDLVTYTEKYSILLDGGIRNIEAAGTNDLTSSGLVGFRFDNERTQFRISFSALSSFDQISSNNQYDYARNVLNTGVSKPGLSSLSFELNQRFLSKKGFQRYLGVKELKKNENDSTTAIFLKTLKRNKLDKVNGFQRRIGLRIYGEVANSQWVHTELKTPTNVSIISFGSHLTWNKQWNVMESFEVSFVAGAGVTSRILVNDISQGQYDSTRNSILGTKQEFFIGPEVYAALNIGNIYAKFNMPYIIADNEVAGLTNGQPIISIGLTADVGQIKNITRKFSQVTNGSFQTIK